MADGFRIDGRDYPLPTQETLTMDEAIVVYDYCGLTLDQLADNLLNPKLLKALVHIAYARGNPDTTPEEISEVVGAVSLMSMVDGLVVGDEPDMDPPNSESPSAEPPSSGDVSNGPSATSPANGHPDFSGPPQSVTRLTYAQPTSEE